MFLEADKKQQVMVTLLACAPQIKTEQVNLSGARTHFVVAVGDQDTACSMAFPHWESLPWEVNESGSQDRTPECQELTGRRH